MENNNNLLQAMSYDDFVVKCRIMDEACRQWSCFIDEAPERRDGTLFTEFYNDVCEQKYHEYLNDPSYRADCDHFAALSDEEKYKMLTQSSKQQKEENPMAYNKAISANDPQAVEKLTEKLQKCEELQAVMKGVNAHWRKTGTCMGAPGITEEQAKKLDNKIQTTNYSWERQPFASYDLTNNNSEIKRLKSRIAELTRNQEVGFSGWEFSGGRAEANTDMNRLQLFFDDKPNEQQRVQLKANGFKWAPSQDAWQRQLNDNAIYAAGRLDFVKPSDGRTVREHQPKAPVKDTGAR